TCGFVFDFAEVTTSSLSSAIMVNGGHDNAAIAALETVLVILRELAREGSRVELIARTLDRAEFLPLPIADRNDRTADFRAVLIELAECHAPFRAALKRLALREIVS